MTSRLALILLLLAVVIEDARGEIPAGAAGSGRILQGTVSASGGKPIAGTRVLISGFGRGMAFVEEAAATTDARGHYRVDLGKFPWAYQPLRALALSDGFEIGDRKVEPGVTTSDFELSARPWKDTLVRLEDEGGKPVAGVEVQASLAGVTWARPETDSEGGCHIVMAPDIWVILSVKPAGARPIEMLFAVRKDGPASISLPVVSPIRGRVLDPDGKPIPDVAVGRWITLGSDESGEMLPFFSGAQAVTDREGRFAIAPEIQLKGSQLEQRNASHLPQTLCFADPSFRRMAYRFFNPTRPAAPMEVTLEPTRRVRLPIAGDPAGDVPRTELSAEIYLVPRPNAPEIQYYFITRPVITKAVGAGPVLQEYLPEGTYNFVVSARDPDTGTTRGQSQRRVVVPRGEGLVELPPLELAKPEQRTWIGKPAPEIAATDLDTGKPVTLAEFRGKVVVLDFWGYWCGPCTGSMPRLMDLQQSFKGRPLAILALHDQSVQSRAEYNQKIAPARRIMWSGHDLPFRVLLDRPDPKKPDDRDPEGTGTTVSRYAIKGFPQRVLEIIGRRTGHMLTRAMICRSRSLSETLVPKRLAEKAEAR